VDDLLQRVDQLQAGLKRLKEQLRARAEADVRAAELGADTAPLGQVLASLQELRRGTGQLWRQVSQGTIDRDAGERSLEQLRLSFAEIASQCEPGRSNGAASEGQAGHSGPSILREQCRESK